MSPFVKRIVGWGLAAIVAASAPIIARWEGKRNETYRDVAGVLTVCYGETRPKYAYIGARYTDSQCLDILTESIILHYQEMRRCVHAPQSLWETVATLSMFYHFGGTKMCPSTFVRMINAGEPPEAYCPQILRWNNALVNGVMQPVKGLTLRKQDEYALCMGNSPWLVKPTTLLNFSIN